MRVVGVRQHRAMKMDANASLGVAVAGLEEFTCVQPLLRDGLENGLGFEAWAAAERRSIARAGRRRSYGKSVVKTERQLWMGHNDTCSSSIQEMNDAVVDMGLAHEGQWPVFLSSNRKRGGGQLSKPSLIAPVNGRHAKPRS